MDMDCRIEEMDKFLWYLGQEKLQPTDEFIDKGKQLGAEVLKMLKHKSTFSIAEVDLSGSNGKTIDILYSHLDLIPVINNVIPPVKDVLGDFMNILFGNYKDLEIWPHSIEMKAYSIQFEFTNGIEVDLIPAVSCETDEYTQASMSYYIYSSSLVGRQLAFITSHKSNFVHVVIRNAKLWFNVFRVSKTYQSRRPHHRFSGRNSIIELMSIAAADKEETRAKAINEMPSALRAFTDVIDMALKIYELKLAFQEVSKDQWERIPLNELESCPLLPVNILKRKHFIVEPTHPHNDLLWNREASRLFKLFAKRTKEQLTKLMTGEDRTSADLTSDILKLFIPMTGNPFQRCKSGIPEDFHLTCSSQFSSQYCDVEIHRNKPLKRREVKLVIDILKRKLCTVICLTAAGIELSGEGSAISDMKKAVMAMFAIDLESVTESQDGEMDVTISVPYEIHGQRYSVQLGMRWN